MRKTSQSIEKFSFYLRLIYFLQLLPFLLIVCFGLISIIMNSDFFLVNWRQLLAFGNLFLFGIIIGIILIGKEILKMKTFSFFILISLLVASLCEKLILITIISNKSYYPFPLLGNFIGIFIDLFFIIYLLYFTGEFLGYNTRE
ncbi:MAG: hypothetical protein HY761_07930 [Candidatus Omnitrophica bacterium]|nr:hypothetical protein [Candidatus Omnitrophota bacterium]